jgi:hypothetical protein
MSHKASAKKLLLAVATAGLTTCDGTGAVDPAPEPLVCDDVSKGERLQATGSFEGQTLSLWVENLDWAWAEAPAITAVSGLTIDDVDATELYSIGITATLESGATTGQFQVKGSTTDGETTCQVTRTFTVTLNAGNLEITLREDLPLAPRRHASIQMLRREGLEVDLRASGAGAGERVAWTPTAGSVEVAEGGQARWRLPAEPGVYQVEMLIDRGEDGFSLDTLAIEVI